MTTQAEGSHDRADERPDALDLVFCYIMRECCLPYHHLACPGALAASAAAVKPGKAAIIDL
jgi:hypothetical protein